METCDEATAMFMGEALLSHAREIRRYAKTYCLPSPANQAIAEGPKRKFTRTVERMINEMHALMLMAKYKGASRFCNREQIDAYMEEARAAIAPVAAVIPALAETGFPSPSLN